MTDVLDELESLLPRIPQAVAHQKVSNLVDRLFDKLLDFQQTQARLQAILDASDQIDFVDDYIISMRSASREAATALKAASDENTIEDAEEAYSELKKAISAADRAVRHYWKVVILRDFTPLVTVGRLLRQFGDTNDIGDRMEALGTRADQSINVASLTELRDIIRALKVERSQLEAEKAAMTKNPEVDQFLGKLAAGDATLATVTPTVFQWLSEHGALSELAVRPLARSLF
ncbi:hypothetical protein GR211_33335 [Rhizobium leguminosarum]|uniref:hypothetical protein n=1 Tax=Rhizobium ruizarguesonis TaxID=2081791 RepID=UPI0013BD204F|nr:hypothetical protein [Rhizobium ruizarguesonis]NEJ17733.1 hypothetical protein [Rhizobium ruizarguesonis]NEK31711.1 hypothetical protein [Rhizobium ruizarguesonis]